jgi:FlgD Ig-like domain
MTNLVDEFFKRNLSESEAQDLEQLLGHSPDEASRFAERMKQEYLSLGLPAPQLPRHLAHTASAGLSPWVSTLVAGGFLSAAALTWWFWPAPKAALLAPVPPAPLTATVAITPHAKALLSPPPPAIPEPVTGSTEAGNRLNVVVDLDAAAPVKVSVLDPKDQAVRVLYEGTLQAGKWSLRWDGKCADGSRAPAGDYRIEVESGAHRMTRTVSIAPAH